MEREIVCLKVVVQLGLTWKKSPVWVQQQPSLWTVIRFSTVILHCKNAVSAYHNLKRTWLTDYNDTKFIVIGQLDEKLWFLKDLIFMPICVPVSNCRKCGIWVHKALRIYLLMLKNWCDGDLYITVTAQEFFQEPAMNMFSKKNEPKFTKSSILMQFLPLDKINSLKNHNSSCILPTCMNLIWKLS